MLMFANVSVQYCLLLSSALCVYTYGLRNENEFWNVHGIMNTWVSCKVSEAQRGPC